ncbi:MAG TPA: response regulator [Bacteroidia bacterium]|jgi:signal transduction histidine kinase|nr:response regulator [Bacteroidia bacterium]
MKIDDIVKILIVDDRKENLFALEVILSDENYKCIRASSGEEALEILKTEQDFAIILMDVQMPMMDGFETVELIRKKEKLKQVPIIFLTASMDSSAQIFKGYLAGAVDYMIKPYSPEILRAKVAVFVDLYKKNHELLLQKEEMERLITDITNLKKVENELIIGKYEAERATQKAKEADSLKDAFLANMSHEIRTPMNAIIGFADILSQRKLGDQEMEYVAIIKTAGENLLTIINDILDLSKIEAGMMVFEKNHFSVKEVFKSLNIMLMGKAKEKNIGLLFSYDLDFPNVLLGDRMRLTQIIINLIGNAIKFTEKGKVQVYAKVRQRAGENILVEFSVKDTGIGIPRNKLKHIFERFSQAESYTTRKYGGTGLGLSIAKELVELQGGTFSVKSMLKKGSEFSFCIPYKESAEFLPVQEDIGKKYNMKALGELKILLVEDNQLNVKLIMSLFSENNLKLQIAENGSVCIEKVKENDFDIILMDMDMPVMNGYEAATIIRKEMKNNIPIIAVTAHAMADEKERCLSIGMNDYISKPINANLLFEKMYNLTLNAKIV